MIENFGNIKNALIKTASALEELINLQNSMQQTMQENANKKTEYGSRISLFSEKYEQLLDLYYVLQKERAERELLLLEAKSSVGETNFNEERIDFVNNQNSTHVIANEIIDLYMQLSELKTSIMVEQEKLLDLEYKKGVLQAKEKGGRQNVTHIGSSMSIEEIKDKIDELKESYKHLYSLKNDAEVSMQNAVKEFELKTKMLSYKLDELQDVSALVSALLYRYNFTSEEECKQYITTDNMIKLKISEINSYNTRLTRLEVQYALLYEESGSSEEAKVADIISKKKENDEMQMRVGEINILISDLEKQQKEYEEILKLKKTI